MDETNSLLYESANRYRLHLDNLRWGLLAGYAGLMTALVSLAHDGQGQPLCNNTSVNALLLVLSTAYFWVLSIQNWFYNLWARYVRECEQLLIAGKRLPALEVFAKKEGCKVSPYHPAFFLVQVVVGLIGTYFLVALVYEVLAPFQPFSTDSSGITRYVAAAPFAVAYVYGHHLALRYWDRLVYRKILLRFSNIYDPERRGAHSRRKSR